MLKYKCLHAHLACAARAVLPRLANRRCLQIPFPGSTGAPSLYGLMKGIPQPHGPWHPMTHGQLRQHSCSASSSSFGAQSYHEQPLTSPLWQRILRFLIKVTAGLMLFSITTLALFPAIISSSTGLHAVLAVTNNFVPGHIAIDKVYSLLSCMQVTLKRCTGSFSHKPCSLAHCMQADVGWRRPARISNVRWLDSGSKDAREMAAIKSLSTSKSLWDVVRGREFEATIDKPTVLGATDVDGEACILKVIEVTHPAPAHLYSSCQQGTYHTAHNVGEGV